MTTHEFAAILLAAEDKPLYTRECLDYDYTRYSDIVGVQEGIVEGGYILEVDYLSAHPNDKRWTKGDFKATFVYDEDGSMEGIGSADDFLYMTMCNASTYLGSDILCTFETPNEEYNLDGVLDPFVSVVIGDEGFNPIWTYLPLEEAKLWYMENFKYLAEEYE